MIAAARDERKGLPKAVNNWCTFVWFWAVSPKTHRSHQFNIVLTSIKRIGLKLTLATQFPCRSCYRDASRRAPASNSIV